MILYLRPARITVAALRACIGTQRDIGTQRRIAACSDGEFRLWLRA